MRYLIIFSIFFFTFSFSFSQEWKLIDEDTEGSKTYIRAHSHNSAWIKKTKEDVPLDYEKYGFDKTIEGYVLLLYRFDCRSKKLGTLVTNYYNNDGDVKHSVQLKDYQVEMNYAVPESVGEFWVKTFCELDKESKTPKN